MKRILLMIMLLVPVALMAKEKQDDSKYLAGAVPQDANGVVVFSQKFAVDGKGKAEIFNKLQAWAAGVSDAAIKDLRTRLLDENKEEGLIVRRIEEWMVFRRLPLVLDRTRFRYILKIQCSDGLAELSISQISYYYEEDTNGQNGQLYKAEEWISDKYALNKKQTKMYKYSAKFRRKTVDRAEELFASARECFEYDDETEDKFRQTKVIK